MPSIALMLKTHLLLVLTDVHTIMLQAKGFSEFYILFLFLIVSLLTT